MNSIPTDTILVLGNGFDLDLGFKTGYKHFLLYLKKYDDDNLIKSIIYRYKKENGWIDLEYYLRDWALNDKCPNCPFNSNSIKESFKILIQLLNEYMQYEKYPPSDSINRTYNTNSCAYKLLQWITKQSPNSISIYSLNYTDMNQLSKELNTIYDAGINLSYTQIINIHGQCIPTDKQQSPQLIIGTDPNEYIFDHYSFLIKSMQPSYVPGITNALDSAKHVIFFGVGFGITDFPYFSPFFQSIHDGNKPDVKISLFTKGDSTSFYKQVNKMITGSLAKFKDLSNISIYDTSNPNCFNKFQNNN